MSIYTVIAIAACVVNLLIFILELFIVRSKPDGVIHVSEGRYLFEFSVDPEKIPRMKIVKFKVKLEEDHHHDR